MSTIRVRVAQLEAWLREEFPCPDPVRVVWVPEIPDPDSKRGLYGQCVPRDGRRWEIQLSERACRTRAEAIEALIHEWTHARAPLRSTDRVEHPKRYWIEYGAIYVAAYERGGLDECDGYHRHAAA